MADKLCRVNIHLTELGRQSSKPMNTDSALLVFLDWRSLVAKGVG